MHRIYNHSKAKREAIARHSLANTVAITAAVYDMSVKRVQRYRNEFGVAGNRLHLAENPDAECPSSKAGGGTSSKGLPGFMTMRTSEGFCKWPEANQ